MRLLVSTIIGVIIGHMLMRAVYGQTSPLPPLPHYFPAPDSAEGIAIQAEADALGVYSAKLWTKGVTNDVVLQTRDHPKPIKRGTGLCARLVKHPPDLVTFEVTYYDKLTGNPTEIVRRTRDGKSGFQKTEIIKE